MVLDGAPVHGLQFAEETIDLAAVGLCQFGLNFTDAKPDSRIPQEPIPGIACRGRCVARSFGGGGGVRRFHEAVTKAFLAGFHFVHDQRTDMNLGIST